MLEEAIVSGELAPGAVLRQEQLSARFSVSRTPVREALRRLAALQLVSLVPNRGARVRTLSREDLREAFLIRAELESLATVLAIANMTEADLAALDEAARRFSQLTTDLRLRTRVGRVTGKLVSEWMRANHAFHDIVYSAARAPLVERLAKSMRRTFFGQAIWGEGLELEELYRQNDAQHRAIRAAIASGSAEAARELARRLRNRLVRGSVLGRRRYLHPSI